MVNDFSQLYYKDAYMQEFEAFVTGHRQQKNSKYISLSVTCFYPLGGGQPGDTGQLFYEQQDGSQFVIQVLDTRWDEDIIWHQVDQLIPIGSRVKGKIDFLRRYDLMQQHSGEHIISGIVNRKYSYNNVGFHINEELTTFDFDGELTWRDIEEIEVEANHAVQKNLPFKIYYLSQEEQKNRTYRSKLDLKDRVRIVEVPGYDICACAGTHVRSSAEIGLIKIIKRESYKGGVRLTVLCGQRALRYFQKLQALVQESGEMLSANVENYMQALLSKLEEVEQLKRVIQTKNKAWLDLFIKNLSPDEKNIVIHNDNLFSKTEWQYIAKNIAVHTDGLVAILTPVEKDLHLLFMHSENLNLKPVIPLLKEKISFQGGGNQHTVQGQARAEFRQIETILRQID